MINLDLDEAFPIIEGVIIEYTDSRRFNMYLANNLLLQLDGKGMTYLDYIGETKINPKTDYYEAKSKNIDILNKFKKQGGIIL